MGNVFKYARRRSRLSRSTGAATSLGRFFRLYCFWRRACRWQLFHEPQAGILEFEGTFEGAVIRAKLHKLEPEKFLLMNRGFRWVNEVPFNR